jgi:hypothetical protein
VTLVVPSVAVHGRWIKHTHPGSAPLPAREPPPDNRWQRGDVVDALHLADTEETSRALTVYPGLSDPLFVVGRTYTMRVPV